MNNGAMLPGDGALPGSDGDAELAQVLEGYLADLEAGRAVDPAWLVAEHPAIAGRLRACLDSLRVVAGEAGVLSTETIPPGLADRLDCEIKREIGRGGMGVVYLVHNTLMGRDEVVKVIGRQISERPGTLDRFLREIRAVARLHHPNIVAAYHAVRLGDRLVFAMEYVDGLDLSRLVKARGPMPVAFACDFARQAALGIQHAHEQGLVHRDIKPGNLMLARAGDRATIKILDFGLAKVVREETVDGSLTHEGQSLGTPHYVAPEQILDASNADIRADIYSLGCTLYYLLTGRPPHEANSLYDLHQAHISRDAAPLSSVRAEVPAGLSELVAKMMARDPAHRFQTPDEVARALEPFVKNGNVLFKTSEADASRVDLDRTTAAGPATGALSSTVPPPTDAAAPVDLREVAAEPEAAVPEASWESLLEYKQTKGGQEAAPAIPPRRRLPGVWLAGAAALLLLLAGLGATEATGVTHLSTTIIRILVPGGTLVVETNDPGIQVTIEGDGGLVINGAGSQEVRLRPGSYQVRSSKAGNPVPMDRDLVTITRGDKQVVKVRLEGEPAAAAKVVAKTEPRAFVVLGGKGVAERKFDTLVEAVQGSSAGDTIEVRGNGPFVTAPVDVRHSLTIRAADGFRPVIRLSPEAADRRADLIYSESRLVLEGLELWGTRLSAAKDSGWTTVVHNEAPLHIANCRLVGNGTSRMIQGPSLCRLSNCELLSDGGTDAVFKCEDQARWTIDNCILAGPMIGIQRCAPGNGDVHVQVTRITCLVGVNAFGLSASMAPTLPDRDRGKASLVLDVSRSIIKAYSVVEFSQNESQPQRVSLEGRETFLRRFFHWRGEYNAYALASGFVSKHPNGPVVYPAPIKALDEWRQLSGSVERECVQGPLRFQGGDLLARAVAAPDQLTPEDFRLRPDSAGYRAGPDGKDLGAEIDLVGPGPAYERWKKTPAYQQWLKDTGPFTSVPQKPGSPFVVKGGKGVADRKFDTLVEAVQGSSEGDTIEIRGNGPFVTKQVDVGHALTIRAAAAFRPVIRLSPEAAESSAALISSNSPLVLEGLELWGTRLSAAKDGGWTTVVFAEGPLLHIANCRLVSNGSNRMIEAPRLCRLTNCEVLAKGASDLALNCENDARLTIDNCLLAGTDNWIKGCAPGIGGVQLQITHSTCLMEDMVFVLGVRMPPTLPDEGRGKAAVAIDVSQTIIQTRKSLVEFAQNDGQPQGITVDERDAFLQRFFRWRGEYNAYAPAGGFITHNLKGQRLYPATITQMDEWRRFWGSAEHGCVQGTVKFQGGDLLARAVSAPDQLTPEDFRLRPDSAGYRAGPDGKDLGAEIDLIGPGPAYERWKMAPAYQEWLKDTGAVTSVPQETILPVVVPGGRAFVEQRQDWTSLFNRKDLSGWTVDGGNPSDWRVEEGNLVVTGSGDWRKSGFLLSDRDFTDFHLRFEFQPSVGSNSGVTFRALPGEFAGKLAHPLQVELFDRNGPVKIGSFLWSTSVERSGILPPNRPAQMKQAGEWNTMEIDLQADALRVSVNGTEVLGTDLGALAGRPEPNPALKRRSGRIGFQSHTGRVRFRNIEMKELAGRAETLDDAARARNGLEAGVTAARRMVALRPDDAQAHVNLGDALYAQGTTNSREAAGDAYREAIRLKPDDPAPHYQLAEALRWLGVLDQAIPEYREAFRLAPNDDRFSRWEFIRILAGAADVRLRNPAEALEHARKAVEITHGIDPEFWIMLALAEYRSGHWEEALAALEKVVTLGGTVDACSWFLRTLIHAQRGDKDQARPWYDKAVAWMKATRNTETVQNVLWAEADTLFGQPGAAPRVLGTGDDAVAACREAIRLEPNNVAAYSNLGDTLREQGKLDDAIAVYRDAIRLEPSHAVLHVALANALKGKGLRDQVLAEFREAIRLEPDGLCWARSNLAWLLANAPEPGQRNPAEALEHARKGVEITGGSHPAFYRTLALAEYRLGHWAEALAALARCKPSHREQYGYEWFLLALVHAQMGDKEQARSWFDKAVVWMKANSGGTDLRQLWTEAAELLGQPGPNAPVPKVGPK